MFIEREARRDAKGLSDLLDYEALVEDGVVRMSSGAYIAAWEFAGRDMDALPVDECFAIADRLARNFSLGASWSLECHLIRSEYTEYVDTEGEWPDPMAMLIEEERRNRFLLKGVEGATRLSRYFFALSYQPNDKGIAAIARKLVGVGDDPSDGGDVNLARFIKKVGDIDGALTANLKVVRRLKGYSRVLGQMEVHCDALLEFIRYCVTGEDYPFPVPEVPIDLSQYIANDDFTGGGLMQLGDPMDELLPGKFIRVIAIDMFPELSFAGIMREMDSLPIGFRLTHQAEILDEQLAAKKHTENKKQWRFKGTGGLKGQIRNPGVLDLDDVALVLAKDASSASSAAEHGQEAFCRYSGKVILLETDLAVLRENSRLIARTLKLKCGFGCRMESVNGVAAWLASMVGQQYKDPRKFVINTVNLTHMMPLSQPWRGREYNPSPYFPPRSAPLFYAATGGGAPYRFNSYVDDVGHLVCAGPNGSGKTAFAGLSMIQALRYPGAQVYAFDKKKSLYTLTKCVGGKFVDLSPESGASLCPLADLSTQYQRQWAEQWIAFLVEMNGLKVTPPIRNDIRDAVERLSGSSGASRSLNSLHMACSLRPLKEALEFYLGTILDGEEDGLEMSRFVVFEMDRLYSLDSRIMNGALFYIFARIRKRLSSDIPTFMFVDEFRAALSHPLAAKAFEDYLFEGRKLNLAVWLFVQELSQTLASPLKGAVLEQTFTKIFLPNPQAVLEGRSNYTALGCNSVDVAAIASAQPKSHYYVMSPEGNRMISLELGPVMLSLLASGDKDRLALDSLIERLGERKAVAAWLRRRSLDDWAERYEFLAGIGEEETAMEAVNQYAQHA